MQTITIHGRRTLHGSIRPAAAKNSTLPLLAATLLCDGPCRLRDVPRLADVDTSLALLDAVGARVRRCGAVRRGRVRTCGEDTEGARLAVNRRIVQASAHIGDQALLQT